MNLINNPLTNPLLFPVLIRLAYILGAGFVIVLIFSIKNMKGMFRSETWKRYITWVVMAPTFMLSVFFGGIVALLFIGFLIRQSLKEYWNMINLPHLYRRVLLFNGILSIVIGAFVPDLVSLLPLIYFLIIVFVSILNNQLENVFNNVCQTLFGSLWICFTLTHFLMFRTVENGAGLLILIGFSVAMADICAFCFGKLFYQLNIGTSHTIASRISPNKTYAGTLGNIIGAVIGVIIFSSLNTHIPLKLLVYMGVCIGISSVLGDLSESMIKRFSEVKDSSDAIPGHGGFLDRLDSLLIVIIVCYYFIRFFV